MAGAVEVPTSRKNKKMLVVGLACVDIVNTVPQYPVEDSDQRCLEQRWSVGGNAANTSTVLAQLLSANPNRNPNPNPHTDTSGGVECLATLAKDGHLTQFILEELARFGVSTEHVVLCEDAHTPCSCVIINCATGSRTILHGNRDLPELTAQPHFTHLHLMHYCWVHFEGRNVEHVKDMIRHIEQYNACSKGSSSQVVVSVEVEKPETHNIDQLMSLADIVFISKDFALHRGYTDMTTAVQQLYTYCSKPGSILFCGWGDMGAAGFSQNELITSSSFKPERIVDTLGAGDTFIAGVIFGMSCAKLSPKAALTFGCRVAGIKCGIRGFNLKDHYNELVIIE